MSSLASAGSGLGQISMLTAKCPLLDLTSCWWNLESGHSLSGAREAGITDEEIDTHGYSVIALELAAEDNPLPSV